MNTKPYLTPAQSSRPFSSDRSGFILAEGAGIVQLEELEHALQRNADIFAEVKGYGQTSDAYNLTQPKPDAE